MLAVSSQLTSGVWLSWFLIMSFYYFISLFSMQKKFEDLLRNKNITTEIRAQALENIFPLLILIGRVVRVVEITEWFGITPFTAVDVCRRYSTTRPRYPLSHFVYFYYYYFLIQYLSRGIQFSRATSLQLNGALTQQKTKTLKHYGSSSYIPKKGVSWRFHP